MTSESKSIRKRGRPKAFDDKDVEIALQPDVIKGKTRRQHLNVTYAHKALKVLMKGERMPPEFRWLYDLSRKEETSGYYRTTILTELGRMEDVVEMRMVAKAVCRLKPRANDAAAWIRRRRLGKVASPDSAQLFSEIEETIRDYKSRYPELTGAQVRNALYTILGHRPKARES